MASLVWMGLGLALLVFAGDRLVDDATAVARRARVPPAVVALTIVAAGTSLPELLVSALASLDGQGGIAAGNVLGSNIFNVGFILGATALVSPIPTTRQVLRVDWPILLLATAAGALTLRDGAVDRAEGLFLAAACLGFLGFSVWYARRVMPADEVPTDDAVRFGVPDRSPALLAVGLVGSLVGLGLGADWFVDGAAGVARAVGWSDRVIGLTVVSAGTGAPEVVSSLAAARKGQHDMAVANVIGSNVFNVLGILGAAALVRPLAVPDLTVDVGVALAFTVALGPVLWFQSRITRPEGAALLLAWVGYTAWLVVAGAA